MKKVKVIWSKDTAEKVAAAKTAKYGQVFTTAPYAGGGFVIVTVEPASARSIGDVNPLVGWGIA